MSAWIVYSKDGQTERCKLKKLEYSGSFMNERTVTATFEYHSEVAFEVFDYIVYRGEKFELEAIPSVKKISSMDYQYELRFVSLKYELERCEMRDIVPNDNGITYPTPLTFSFTGDVRYLAERIQANLDALYGQGVWAIVVSDDVESEEKNITIAQQNCWNALSLVNTTYGLNFSIKGRVVTVGGNQPTVGHTFQYGKGNGLYEIERNSDTDTGIVTKLRAYGSTRNLDYSYPKKPEWTDSVLPVSFILSPLRLMLPSFKEDGKTDYILANEATISEYGIREASVIYDDIYPSITGATNSSGVPIDEIKSVEPIDDSASTFVVYLHDLEFDLESHLTTDNAQISMKSGAMQGYTFNISEIERISNNFYKITLGRITADESDTGNYNIPNSSWHMEAGDKFVFLNILMPQKYIRDAEERLLKRAQEYLAEYGKTNFSYNVGLHDKFLKEHEAVYNELIEGAKLSVYDSELGISENVTVQSITITEYADDNILPQVKVTLNNKPSASTLERIQGQIKELSETSAGQFSTQSELLKQYRRKLDKPFFDRLFAAVDFDGNEIPSTDMTTPIAYIKARTNFASLGGVTMYLDDKSLNLPSIYDGLPIDHDTIYWENGILKSKGGSSVDEGAVKEIIESYGYTTEDWVRDYVLENASGGIESITKKMVIDALGYTPYSAENPNGYITAASIPSALKNPYALTFGSKTYDGSSAKEITASDLGAALSSDLSKYLPISSYTASDVLAKLVTVDGSGSGLDADLLDGKQATSFVWEDMYPNSSDNNYALNTGIYRTTSNTEGLPYKNTGNSVIHCNWDNNAANQLFLRYDGDYIAYRRKDRNAWKPWKQLAFTDSNVASATYATTSGNADTLDGVHLMGKGGNSGIMRAWNRHEGCTISKQYFGNGNVVVMDPKPTDDSNLWANTTIFSLGDMEIRSHQLAFGYGEDVILYRRVYDGPTYNSWKTIAFTDSNVASATKLKTARTIWGQSFDGTGNVDGALQIKAGNYIANRATLILNSNRGHAGDIIFKSGSTTKGDYGWWAISSRNDSTGSLAIYRGPENAANPTELRVINIEPSGNILTTGGITMYSARILKDVVDERGLSLSELSAIKPTRYTWKDKRDDRLHFGGIADDIQQVLPEVVYKTEEGVLTMDYGNAGFAIASSLIKPVIDHEERIKALERENKELKEQIKQIKCA